MIENLALHDATLKVIEVDWPEGTCTLRIATAADADCSVTFTGVSEVSIPRHQPWGRSVSINSAREISAGKYEVELQSGDILRISAAQCSFE